MSTERVLGRADCKWCMPENSMDPPKWCRHWEGCKLSDQFEIKWEDFGREPKCEPNPDYPNGLDVRLGYETKSCIVPLPYPAKRCGLYFVYCKTCGCRLGITTAGRPDDPRSVEMPCKEKPN